MAVGQNTIEDGLRLISTGVKAVTAAATPEALVASSTPCRKVWVGAPCGDTGTGTNTKTAYTGKAGENNQNRPLISSNIGGYWIICDDASLVYVKVGADAESVNFEVWG